MRKLALILSLAVAAPSLAADVIPLTPFARTDRPTVSITADNSSRTVLHVSIPAVGSETVLAGDGERAFVAFPGSGTLGRIGAPDVPTYGTMVAIPPTAAVAARVRVLSESVVPVARLAAVPNEDGTPALDDESIYSIDAYYPAQPEVYVGEPAIMAGVRVVPVNVAAARYNPVRGELSVASEFEIEIDYAGMDVTNAVVGTRSIPRSMAELVGAFTPNYGDGADWGNLPVTERGTIIYLTKSTYTATLQPLVDWRREQGYNVIVQSVDAIPGGNTQGAIDSWIQTQYNSLIIPLEHVVLVGDRESSYGPVDYPYGSYASDHAYSRNAGSDYLADVYVGRMSVQNTSQLATLVAKMLAYERNTADLPNGWLKRGLVVAGNIGATSPRTTVLWARERMLAHGYTQVDSVFDWGGGAPNWGTINTAINDGVGYVFYRGWAGATTWYNPSWGVSNIYALTNGWRNGVMASIVCGTGNFGYSECFGEAWIRAGTPTTPKAGVAFSGYTDGSTHTVWNNPILISYAWSLFDEGLHLIGQNFLSGKTAEYDAFPLNRYAGGYVEHYNNIYNLLGDPALQCWVTTPTVMSVGHPDTLAVGSSFISVTVFDGLPSPVPDAYVNVLKGTYPSYEVFAGGRVDSNGFISLPVGLVSPGTLRLTVCARNHVPYQVDIPVVNVDVALDLNSTSLDGMIDVGDSQTFDVTLRNIGTGTTATGITASLTSSDPLVAVTNGGPVSFPDAAPGDTSTSSSQFEVSTSPYTPPAYSLNLTLSATSNEGSWTVLIPVVASGPGVRVVSTTILDPNSRLDPGETDLLTMQVQNSGNVDMPVCTLLLRTSDPLITVIDSIGAVPALSVGAQSGLTDTFVVQCSPATYNGHVSPFQVTALAGLAEPSGQFNIVVGFADTDDPGGPTAYGYYCYDNTDLLSGHGPSYEWVDIHTIGTNLNLTDDQTVKRAVPVNFVYHGVTVDTISISSNGFIIPDTSTFAGFYNWGLPFPENDGGMIAPFWDDLATSGSNNVYVYYDGVNQRYIVEWYNVYHSEVSTMPNLRFACYLYDADARPTPTGDSEIEFHYNNILNLDNRNDQNDVGNYASVGIMSYDREDGFTYTFANQYHPTCPTLANGRAIKFTTSGETITGAPDGPIVPTEFALAQNHPNPFNPVTSISFDLPRAARVRLAVYDILGREVATIVDGSMSAGRHTATWDASGLASGVYFARLATDTDSAVRKMVLLK